MLSFLPTTLLLLLSLFSSSSYAVNYKKSPSKDAVLLSNIQTLTLYGNRKTSHRRISAIPQLACVGPSKVCSLYKVDVMRCVNAGSDYDENDVQWTCTAELPPEFKLGSTDVVCEGYRNADDPWVLKGSCGVEYRLLLSDLGEKRYGHISVDERTWPEYCFDLLAGISTMAIFFLVFAIICCAGDRRRNNGGGWFGGGGGGGWGGGPPGPPPPYDDPQPPGYTKYESWRPGFWTGALGGTAAGYAMGRRGSPNRGYGGSPGPSDWGSRPGPSRSSSSMTESTGFGSTRRR